MKVTRQTRLTQIQRTIIELILSGPALNSYYKKEQWWYVVKLNEGCYIHHTFYWKRQTQVIEYKLSPHIEKF